MKEYKMSPEEEAANQFVGEALEELTEAGKEAIRVAHRTGCAANLVINYAFQPGEYDEAVEELRDLELTERDHELLAELAFFYKKACMSVDATDRETTAGHKVFASDV